MIRRASWAALARVGGASLVDAQTQCFRCSLDGTDCIRNTPDGASGCDTPGGRSGVSSHEIGAARASYLELKHDRSPHRGAAPPGSCTRSLRRGRCAL